MQNDIATLQYLYGANYNTNSGNTVYSWNPSTGRTFIDGVSTGPVAGNRIFMTVWDGGGTDTYDLSAYSSNLSIDLQPGAWSTFNTSAIAQRAFLGNGHTAAGNVANALLYNGNTQSLIENVIGGTGDDTIVGNVVSNNLQGGDGNDILNGLGGADVLTGGAGADTFQIRCHGVWRYPGSDRRLQFRGQRCHRSLVDRFGYRRKSFLLCEGSAVGQQRVAGGRSGRDRLDLRLGHDRADQQREPGRRHQVAHWPVVDGHDHGGRRQRDAEPTPIRLPTRQTNTIGRAGRRPTTASTRFFP